RAELPRSHLLAQGPRAVRLAGRARVGSTGARDHRGAPGGESERDARRYARRTAPMSELEILYEDNHVLGVVKPAGMLSQGDRTGDLSALELARRYIKEKHDKPGNVFLGLVQRLDRPVSGVMVFARTSKAASRLSQSFHDREAEKTYLCVVCRNVSKEKG